MILVDNKIISDDVLEKQFVCDLTKCKGACCEDGDAGAPLEEEEKAIIDAVYDIVRPYLTEAAVKEIEKNAIVDALSFTEWNMSKAAKVLGVSRMTLYRKIDSYGIQENE